VGEIDKIKVKWFKDGWIIDGGVGVRTFGKRSANVEKVPGLALQGGLGYMFNSVWGVRGRMGYYNYRLKPNFQQTNAPEGLAHSAILSLTGTVDLIPLISGRKGTIWHLNTYLGAGLTSSWNQEYKDYMRDNNFTDVGDKFIENNDDKGHIVFGVTPQYHFSSRFALTFDVSTFLIFEQDRTHDYNTVISGEGPNGVMNFSLGFIWYPHF
jgi:hypothetical protein